MIKYVNGFEEATKFPVMYGDAEIFIDENLNKAYIKAVDNMGKYTMATYKLELTENPKPLSTEDFVPKAQFDDLNRKMDMLMDMLTSPQPANSFQTSQQNPQVDASIESQTSSIQNQGQGQNRRGQR